MTQRNHSPFLSEFLPVAMDSEILASSKTSHTDAAMPHLTQVPTSVTLSAEQFEKLYLSPMMHRQSGLNKKLGNPTPLYAHPSRGETHSPLTAYFQGTWRFRADSHTFGMLLDGMARSWRWWCCIHVSQVPSEDKPVLMSEVGAC